MTISGIIIRIVVLLCLFQLPLLEVFPIFSYFDELLMGGLLLCFVLKTATKLKVEREDFFVCGSLFLFIILGLICNLTSGVMRPSAAVIQDLITVSKFFICYLGAKYLFCDRGDRWEILAWSAGIIRIIVVVGIACLLFAHLGLLDMLSRSTRMGLRCFEFIYDSPGMLSQYCVLLCVVLTADLSRGKPGRGRWIVWFLALVLWASTLRTRALVMIILMLILVFAVFKPGVRERFQGHAMLKKLFSPLVFIPVVAVVLLVSFDQIDHYFGELESARSYLLHGGLQAFREFFPLGAGFGTYGTESARVYYSPLYVRYGISSHWALGSDGTELTDTFWPAIMGEFGFIGTVLYVVIVFIVLRRIVKSCVAQRFLLASAVSFAVYVLIASTATGVFFSYTISCCMVFIGMIMGCANGSARNNLSNRKGLS